MVVGDDPRHARWRSRSCRYRFRGGSAVNILLVLPLTTPEIVLGASLLHAVHRPRRSSRRVLRRSSSPTSMFCVSFVALTVKARIRGFDWTLEEAAMDLGAGAVAHVPQGHAPADHPRHPRRGAADRSRCRSTTSSSRSSTPARVRHVPAADLRTRSSVDVPPQINVLATMILLVSVRAARARQLAGRQRRRDARSLSRRRLRAPAAVEAPLGARPHRTPANAST